MKNIIANQFPFLLDRNTNTDETLNISLWNGIMFVEFPDGEEITFEPTHQQLDWFEGLAESTASQAQVAVVMAKELANTSIPLPKHVGDDETVYLSIIDDELEISTEYHDQTVAVTAEIRADFDRIAGEPGAKQPAMDEDGCLGCPFCGIAPEPGTQHYEDMLRMYPEFYQTEIEARKSLAEKAARAETSQQPNLLNELPPAGPCSCLYGPNPGYNEYGEYGGYCESCGDLIL